MANSISLAGTYKAALDEVYKLNALTGALEQNTAYIQATDDPKTVKIAKMQLQGLGDYSRFSGYAQADITLEWEPFTLTHDRGRSFQIDAMDDRESLNLPVMTLANEFMTKHVIPEIDAIRFSTMAEKSANKPQAEITTPEAAIAAWDTAQQTLDEEEVPRENRLAYFSTLFYYLIKNDKRTRERLVPGQNSQGHYETIDGVPVSIVPKSRFYSAITLLSGGNGQEAGGYVKASGALDINFQLVHTKAVAAVTKHALPRIFGPDVNQKANATQFDYRIYHDLFVPDNKTAGVYTHIKA